MKNSIIILLVILICFSTNLMAQVAINNDGSPPNESAMLDVISTNKGVLFPRMTQSEIAEITCPIAALMVFNTDNNRFYCYDTEAGEWKQLAIGTGAITPTPPIISSTPFTDIRDGQTYNAVQIGNQFWMAENLNIGTRIDGINNQTNNDTIEKYCFNNNETNCITYGGLYKWDEMMQYTSGEEIQGICPDGWHLPSNAEWSTLTNYLKSLGMSENEMKEVFSTYWFNPNTNTSNSSNSTANLGSYRDGNGNFHSLIYSSYLWSSSELTASKARYLSMDSISGKTNNNKTYSLNVRCIKN